MEFPKGTINRILSKGIREGWPIHKRNWGGEVGPFTYCFLNPIYRRPRASLGGASVLTHSRERLIGLSLGVSQKPKRCEWRQGL